MSSRSCKERTTARYADRCGLAASRIVSGNGLAAKSHETTTRLRRPLLAAWGRNLARAVIQVTSWEGRVCPKAGCSAHSSNSMNERPLSGNVSRPFNVSFVSGTGNGPLRWPTRRHATRFCRSDEAVRMSAYAGTRQSHRWCLDRWCNIADPRNVSPVHLSNAPGAQYASEGKDMTDLEPAAIADARLDA